ncbi:Hyaluronan synthase [uncultured Clostridium sp.]|uniref:glycosyltransferase n=1 Tax=uncultured Clostridium sp. TaxID=59620 RepID=UPI0008222099|nr:glycosyltransferase [uncultured Clostridium sp.]SCK03887.1 Hyaluronan synthase [uncultured Clostridium sp.]
MNSNIKLSIIVPVYNVEKYLDECIQSIIFAYRDGIEVILVDDGSKDNSGEICDKYSKEYEYISVKHRENGGLSAARNTGLRLARGEYIWFIDSDDYIENDSIEVILNKIKEDKDIIIGNYKKVSPDGNISFYQGFKKEDDLTIKPYKYVENLGNVSYAAVRFIAKRELIINNDIFFTEGIYHEDEDWTPRILCSAKSFTTIMNPLYNYRVGNPESITGMLNSKKVLDKIIISKCIYDRIRNNNYSQDIKSFLRTRIAHNYIAALNECAMYKGIARKDLIAELKANKYLLEGIKSKKASMVRVALKIIGVSQTSKLLNMRTKISKDN